MSDELNRDSIVKEINENLFVEAGAGSGKTTMLVRRMVAMVEAGYDVSKICAITFTKAAANEFYDRFYKLLLLRSVEETETKEYGPGDLPRTTEISRANCKKALENIDLCFMNTIDAFTQMIISEHPIEARVPSTAKVISDEEKEELLLREYSNIINGLYGEELANESIRFRDVNYNPSRIFIKTAAQILGLRNARLIIPETENIDLEKEYGQLKKELLEIVETVAAMDKDVILPKPQGEKNKWLDVLASRYNAARNWNENIPSVLLFLKKLKDKDGIRIDYKDNISDFIPHFDKYFVPHETRNKISWYNMNVEMIDEVYKRIQNIQYSISLSFISKCINVIENKLRSEGSLSFFDYLLYLRNLLKEDAKNGGKLIRHIYERHSYFLIDECQDTDPIQSEIFFYLSAENPDERWDRCIPRKGSLFIVGDPKQSIYRFKNADVSSYKKVKNLFKGETGKAINLTRNFRSNTELKNWFNETFLDLLSEDTEDQSRYDIIPNIDDNSDDFNGIYYYNCRPNSNTKGDNPLDPEAVLNIIQTLVDNEKYLFSDKGIKRKIRYSDFMLITGGKPAIKKYSKILSDNDIPCRVEGSIDFKECEALNVLKDMYLAISDTDDNRYLMSVLMSGFYSFSHSDLSKANSDGFEISLNGELNENIDAELRKAIEELKDIRRKSFELSPAALFDYIINNVQVFRYLDTANLEYIYYVLELLRNSENSREIISIKDAGKYLEKIIENNRDIERCQSLSRNENKVHIANLHKVKGLENNIVILVSPTSKEREPSIRTDYSKEQPECKIMSISDKERFNSKLLQTSAFDDDAKIKETDSLNAEKIRLLYVAATRARKVLIVSRGVKKDGSENDNNPWLPLLKHIDKNLYDFIQKRDIDNDAIKDEADSLDLYRDGENLIFDDKSVEEETFKIIRPSRISHEEVKKNDEDIRETDIVYKKKDPLLIGTYVHALMEYIVSSKNSLNLKNAINEIIKEDEDDYYADILRSVYNVMNNGGYKQEGNIEQDLLGLLMNAEETYCELPFCYRKDNDIYNGIIDLVYKKNGKWYIVDYKTNSDPSDLDVIYKEQLNAYIDAFRNITGEIAEAKIYHIDI